MLSIASATYAFAPVAPLNPSTTRSASVKMESVADLKTLSEKLNPVVGFWEPIGLTANVGDTEEATVGWYRHAEIKHGRVAMAAFVGFCVQSNGICFPWDLANGVSFASISAAGGPGAQWDALPAEAKIQIICAVGFLEVIGELSPVLEANGEKHYVKGGKPGYYPPFNGFFNKEYWPHPLPLNLWDPFGTPWTPPPSPASPPLSPRIPPAPQASPRKCRPSARRRPSSPRSTTAASR